MSTVMPSVEPASARPFASRAIETPVDASPHRTHPHPPHPAEGAAGGGDRRGAGAAQHGPRWPGAEAPPRFGERLRHDGLEDADRHFALAMHLSPFAGCAFLPLYFAPLVLWLIRREHSIFADDHGREVINFHISQWVISIVLLVSVIGWIALPVVWVVGLVNMIRGALASSRGEYFRYPMTFRFL